MSSVAGRAIAPLALMVVIFLLSGQRSVGSDLAEWTRWVSHFSEYALLAALWAWALAPELGRRALSAAMAISFFYAISDEFHQSFVEGRDSDPFDVMVDSLGIVAAAVAVAWWWRRERSRRVMD